MLDIPAEPQPNIKTIQSSFDKSPTNKTRNKYFVSVFDRDRRITRYTNRNMLYR